MKIYDKIQSFTTDEVQKKKLDYLQKNKINVSKFIRDAINEKLSKENIVLKEKKYTIEDLKKSMNFNQINP